MDTNRLIIFALAVLGVLIINAVRDRLHWAEPSTRLRIGLGLLAVSIFSFIMTEMFVERPWRVDSGTFAEYLLQGAIVMWTVISILALVLTASAAFQMLQRRRYYQRIGD